MNTEQINARINTLARNFSVQLANMELAKSFLEVELEETKAQLEEANARLEGLEK